MAAGGAEATPALRLDGVRKDFGETRALDGARLVLAAGEVHALLGENGAGKTTLVSIAAGLLAADAGAVVASGRPLRLRSPRDARRAGIALVPQHDVLVEAATVADNLSRLDPSAPLVESRASRRRRAEELARRLGLDLGPPDALVGDLPVGVRQRVEIAGALIPDPAILILDEPTALLAPDEAAALFTALRRRAAAGRTVLLITHRLPEVYAVADRLTVLCRGRTVREARVADVSAEEVAALLLSAAEVGPLERRFAEATIGVEPAGAGEGGSGPAGGPARLSVEGLAPEGSPAVSFSLEPAGILVLLAIDGNGADRIAAAVAGLLPARGVVRVDGRVVPAGSPRAFRAAGGAYVPGDRRSEGVFASLSVAENLALGAGGGPFVLRPTELARVASDRIRRYGIRAAGPAARAGSLSGGNQQKLVLSRELEPPPRALVAVHPTRGLDLASAADVLARLCAVRDGSGAVLVVTADPDEARALGGTIRVVYRGALSPPFPAGAPVADLGRAMAGLAA